MRFSIKELAIVSVGMAIGFGLVFGSCRHEFKVHPWARTVRPNGHADVFYASDTSGRQYVRVIRDAKVISTSDEHTVLKISPLDKIRISIQFSDWLVFPNIRDQPRIDF